MCATTSLSRILYLVSTFLYRKYTYIEGPYIILDMVQYRSRTDIGFLFVCAGRAKLGHVDLIPTHSL